MTRNHETQFEEDVRKGNLVPDKALEYHIDQFNKGGIEKPVKVMPTEATDRDHVSGFFTQERFILGNTPKDMEHILGLKPGDLENGATIYELTQTPGADQFVPGGYTHLPGGQPFQEGSEYPPGDGVKQFKLKEEVPAKVVGKLNYEEVWKGPVGQTKDKSISQSISEMPKLNGVEMAQTTGSVAGSAAAGPVGGEVGKVGGKVAGEAGSEGIKSVGQSTQNPVQGNQQAANENTASKTNNTDEEEQQGYGYGY